MDSSLPKFVRHRRTLEAVLRRAIEIDQQLSKLLCFRIHCINLSIRPVPAMILQL